MSFTQFYANGGLFMHLVTFSYVSALAALGTHVLTKAASRGVDRHLDLAKALSWMGLLLGLLGSLNGVAEMCGALRSVDDPVQWQAAVARATPIVLYTLGWAVACCIPVLTLSTGMRFMAQRRAERASEA